MAFFCQDTGNGGDDQDQQQNANEQDRKDCQRNNIKNAHANSPVETCLCSGSRRVNPRRPSGSDGGTYACDHGFLTRFPESAHPRQSRIANEDQPRHCQNYPYIPPFADFRSLLSVTGPSTVSIDNSAVIFLLSELSGQPEVNVPDQSTNVWQRPILD
jgi:hypothetical protein